MMNKLNLSILAELSTSKSTNLPILWVDFQWSFGRFIEYWKHALSNRVTQPAMNRNNLIQGGIMHRYFRIVVLIAAIFLLSGISLADAGKGVECGDVDGSGFIDIDDVVYLINYIFGGGPPPCPDASGSLVGHGGCKEYWKMPADSIPLNEDCILYEYDGSGQMFLQHINTALNCCPIILADITIDGFDILIEEIDSLWEGVGCPCMCLFDIQYEFVNLDPGIYTISVIEPYKCIGEPDLQFTADLSSATVDTFCITRDCYPWTEM